MHKGLIDEELLLKCYVQTLGISTRPAAQKPLYYDSQNPRDQ